MQVIVTRAGVQSMAWISKTPSLPSTGATQLMHPLQQKLPNQRPSPQKIKKQTIHHHLIIFLKFIIFWNPTKSRLFKARSIPSNPQHVPRSTPWPAWRSLGPDETPPRDSPFRWPNRSPGRHQWHCWVALGQMGQIWHLHIYIGTGEAARQQAIGINRLIAWKKHEKANSGSSNLSKYLRLWLKSGGALSYHQNEPLVEVIVDGRRLQSRYIGVSLNFQLLEMLPSRPVWGFWMDTDLAINCLSPSSHQLHSTALCTTATPGSYNNARQFVHLRMYLMSTPDY